jgi:predicted Zn-dependent peptidase
LLTRGTQSHSSTQFNDELASLGARLHGETGREQSHIGLTVFRNDVSRAISLLGSAVTGARLDAGELELLK